MMINYLYIIDYNYEEELYLSYKNILNLLN